MRPILCAMLGFLLANHVHAEELRSYILMGGTGAHPVQAAFVDASSIVKDGDQVTYWTLWAYSKPVQFSSAKLSYVMRQNVDDCGKDLSRQTFVAGFDDEGRQINNDLDHSTPMAPIAPESIGGQMHRFVCFGKAPFDTPPTVISTIAEALQAAALFEAFQGN